MQLPSFSKAWRYDCLPPIKVFCQELLILTYLASSKMLSNYFVLSPLVRETLVSNLSACLFQVYHILLQFHLLGLWGCLHWSSYFKTHLDFSQASLSPPCCLKTCLVICILCLHPCFLLPLWWDARALIQARPGCRGVRQWVSMLTFKFQVYFEAFHKRSSQPKCQDFQLRVKARFSKG